MDIKTLQLVIQEIEVIRKRYEGALADEPGESLLQRDTIEIAGEEWSMTRAQRYAAMIDSFRRMEDALSGFLDDINLFLDKGANGDVRH